MCPHLPQSRAQGMRRSGWPGWLYAPALSQPPARRDSAGKRNQTSRASGEVGGTVSETRPGNRVPWPCQDLVRGSGSPPRESGGLGSETQEGFPRPVRLTWYKGALEDKQG